MQEKTMATHSSTLALQIPWTEQPGRLQPMRSRGVGHDWVTSLSLFTFMHWRRKWQPTPVFLPGESQGWGSLVGCGLWGRTVRYNWSDLAAAAARVFDRKVIIYTFLHDISIKLEKRIKMIISLYHYEWSTSSVIISLFLKIYFDITISPLAFLCYCLHNLSVSFLLCPTLLCPNI